MSQPIKKSLDKLSRTIKSNSNNQLETLINTPVNSLINKKTLTSPSILQKTSNNVSTTFKPTNSFINIKNILYILLIIFLLALIGLNIFTYLSKGTNFITQLVGPIFSTTGNLIGNATKNLVSTTSTGTQKIVDTGSDTTKNIIDVAATGTTSSVDILQDRLKKTASIVNPENNNVLTDNINKNIDKSDSQPEPVRSQSLQQGYCFTGKINDTRHCAKVNEKQQCMSGDIYPTMDICINPNLRA